MAFTFLPTTKVQYGTFLTTLRISVLVPRPQHRLGVQGLYLGRPVWQRLEWCYYKELNSEQAPLSVGVTRPTGPSLQLTLCSSLHLFTTAVISNWQSLWITNIHYKLPGRVKSGRHRCNAIPTSPWCSTVFERILLCLHPCPSGTCDMNGSDKLAVSRRAPVTRFPRFCFASSRFVGGAFGPLGSKVTVPFS
jgi:hypothetical protein